MLGINFVFVQILYINLALVNLQRDTKLLMTDHDIEK